MEIHHLLIGNCGKKKKDYFNFSFQLDLCRISKIANTIPIINPILTPYIKLFDREPYNEPVMTATTRRKKAYFT